MAIKINDIPPEGLAVELAQTLDLFDSGTASTAFAAELSIKPIGEGSFHISGRIKSEPQLECSRCLKNFAFAIDSAFDVDVAPLTAMGSTAEHELLGGELDMEFYQGDEIEPLDIIKEHLLISMPMVPLHSEDCKGLCPVCGTDLNTAQCGCRKEGPDTFGPFSALKDLFKK